ncbi:MAG: hypothetical protein R2874_02965 [Desulfobacterales bacterium]
MLIVTQENRKTHPLIVKGSQQGWWWMKKKRVFPLRSCCSSRRAFSGRMVASPDTFGYILDFSASDLDAGAVRKAALDLGGGHELVGIFCLYQRRPYSGPPNHHEVKTPLSWGIGTIWSSRAGWKKGYCHSGYRDEPDRE